MTCTFKMAKAWSLKYFSTRLRLACEEGLAQLQTASGSLPVAVQKGMETFDKQLTSVIYITGRSAYCASDISRLCNAAQPARTWYHHPAGA